MLSHPLFASSSLPDNPSNPATRLECALLRRRLRLDDANNLPPINHPSRRNRRGIIEHVSSHSCHLSVGEDYIQVMIMCMTALHELYKRTGLVHGAIAPDVIRYYHTKEDELVGVLQDFDFFNQKEADQAFAQKAKDEEAHRKRQEQKRQKEEEGEKADAAP